MSVNNVDTTTHPCVYEIFGLRRSDDVAPNDLNVGVVLLDVLDHVDLENGVALGGVEDNDVDTGLVEEADPLFVHLLGGDSCPHQQLVVLVLGRVGKIPGLFQIRSGDECHQLI